MRNDRRQTILFVIILLILSMGIGYAFLTTTLSIDGVSDIDSATWDIHWENVQVSPLSVSGSQVISPVTIGNNETAVSFHVKLNEPGDFYGFLLDAVNDGTMNAYVEDVSIKVNGSEDFDLPYLHFAIYDENDNYLDVGALLLAGETRSYYYYVEYYRNVRPNILPTEDVSLNITFQITYSQYSIPSSFNNIYVYSSVLGTNFYIGSPLPNISEIYSNYQIPLYNYCHFNLLRFYVENNNIVSADVGFYNNRRMYYLKGGDGGTAYNANKSILYELFGSDCEEFTDEVSYYYCENGDSRYAVSADGGAYALFRGRTCIVYPTGQSNCENRGW